MKPKQNIMLMAIALVVSGAITYRGAQKECDRLSGELCVHENDDLRQKLEVMQECVAIYKAKDAAINDWNKTKA